MRTSVAGCLIGLFALVVGGCGDDTGAEESGLSGRLTITGSSTVAPLVSEIAQRFERKHPDVRIDVQTGGSSRGIMDAQRGTAEVGMASRKLLDSEKQELTEDVIARDGVGMIVHRDNQVSMMDDQQIRDIFTGQVKRWAEVGGENEPIRVINKADGRATLTVFLEHYALSAAEIQADVVIGDNQHGIRTVAGDPRAIGYVSLGAAEVEMERGTSIRILPVGGAEGTLANLREGSYPLSRPLILITQRNPSRLVEAFVEFAGSEANHDLVEQFSYVPAE